MELLKRKPKNWRRRFTHHLAPETHPILPLYLGALRNLEELKKNPDVGFERNSLELMSFSEALRAAKKINVVDITGKVLPVRLWTKLNERLKNPDNFHQASYEVQIASALRKTGFAVSFIQESLKRGAKTPDLLVREGREKIYVECKYRKLTKRENQYDNMFKEFYWRAMDLMYRLGEFYSICVEWLKDPTITSVKSEVDKLEERVRSKEEGLYETESAKTWLKHLASGEQVFKGSFDIDIGEYLSDDKHVDIVMQQANVGIFEGIVKYKNPTLVMFQNISYLDDLIDGLVELLNKAYRQIPKNGLGIVFLEARLSFLNQQIKETLQDLENRLKGKLNLIGRVNMVILTRSHFSQRNVKIEGRDAVVIARMVESRIVPNLKPTFQISQGTLEKIAHLKYY